MMRSFGISSVGGHFPAFRGSGLISIARLILTEAIVAGGRVPGFDSPVITEDSWEPIGNAKATPAVRDLRCDLFDNGHRPFNSVEVATDKGIVTWNAKF